MLLSHCVKSHKSHILQEVSVRSYVVFEHFGRHLMLFFSCEDYLLFNQIFLKTYCTKDIQRLFNIYNTIYKAAIMIWRWMKWKKKWHYLDNVKFFLFVFYLLKYCKCKYTIIQHIVIMQRCCIMLLNHKCIIYHLKSCVWSS